VVGHSYGGAVITEAASRVAQVAHLVYLTAFALDAGESVLGLLRSLPAAPVALARAVHYHDDGTSTLGDAHLVTEALYGRCPPTMAAAALPRLCAQPTATMVQTVTGSPRASIPSTYVRCTLDQAVDISHQSAMALRCGTVHTLDTDHSPFLSMVSETADILESIARA
jgi:pimeloyl-ACP methyl ester carboxylesterase